MQRESLRRFWTLALAASLALSAAATSHAYLKADGTPVGPGDTPDYLTTPNWAYSPPMRKFLDTLPLLNTPNNLGQMLSVAVPDTASYPGSDYYEIELVEYQEQMHSDLPPTTLRGYRQVNAPAGSPALDPHFLGPVIVSQKDRPVRVKFINSLPTGQAGDLFVPVDTTIMGSGLYDIDWDPITKTPLPAGAARLTGDFAQNRATLHLHGGKSPWISDGTPHQWITPAGEVTDYPTGVSVENVPDMPAPGDGEQTFYWTNQQSSRMMFYHDHAWGITRLNVYVGEAAGYLIRDEVELDLIAREIIPGLNPADEIPLVFMDKTYVDADTLVPDPRDPDPSQPTLPLVPSIFATDPTWQWGTGDIDPATGYPAPVTGDLWWPHVYMPAQNPFDITGIAPMGRWAYGPYFWPPTNNLYQPVPNPYYSANCDPNGDPATTPGLLGGPYGMFCQPPEIPGSPNPSWGAEAFMDTPTVNGTAYPVLTVEPKPYRFRILNAAHDRFLNLQLYKAQPLTIGITSGGSGYSASPTVTVTPGVGETTATTATATATVTGGVITAVTVAVTGPGFTVPPTLSFDDPSGTGAAAYATLNTEVKMLPATDWTAAGAPDTWPTDGRSGGIPDWDMSGPSWIMIGAESGFLPKPVVLPPHPVTWNADVTTFNAGNVIGGSLILAPAERADVIVDFSTVPSGTTLILYNDAPAPWPALDPHYDYFTGSPDLRDIGGADTTLPGYGPNVRTIMQIKVEGAAGAPFDLGTLQAAFRAGGVTGTEQSVFVRGQDPIIAAQGNFNPGADPALFSAFLFPETFDAYQQAYGNAFTFPTTYPNWGISRIGDKAINFIGPYGDTTYAYDPTDFTTAPWDYTKYLYGRMPMEFKAIQDEQGETFDDYGRMRAALGLEFVNPQAGQVNFVVQTYSDPATEILYPDEVQLWKITHNGVDTHPIHFHLYDVQVLNRVGWDGFIRLPDPTELGWKDTVRISPLEDTIVALKPATPLVPFGVPESFRPLNPARALGDNMELSAVDPTTGQAWAVPNVNRFASFDWEYVWHCHILSHEENDMMRPQMYIFDEVLPGAPTGLAASDAGVLTWTDPTPFDWLAPNPFFGLTNAGNPTNEIGFRIERSPDGVNFSEVGKALANASSYTDTTAAGDSSYTYRVVAFNAAGDSVPSDPASTTILPRNGAPTSIWVRTLTSVDTNPVVWGASPTAGVTYELQEAQDPAFSVNLRSVYSGTALRADVTISANGDYYYRVRATQAGYLPSAWVTRGPMTVSNLTATTPASLWVRTTTGVDTNPVVWGASATLGVAYEVEEAQDAAFSVGLRQVYSGTGLRADVTVSANGDYYYRVRATKSGYLPSAWVTRGPMTVTSLMVARPASLWVRTTTGVDTNPVVWGVSATTGVSYELEEAQDAAFSVNLRSVYSGAALNTTATVLTGNGTYYYRVRATKAGYLPSGWVVAGPMTVANVIAARPASIWVRSASPVATNPIVWGASPTIGVSYELEEAQDANFGAGLRQVYAGAALTTNATVIASGTYYYRVRAVKAGYLPSAWVNSIGSVITLP